MKLRSALFSSLAALLVVPAASAAPTIEAPIDVAPRLYVPSDATSEVVTGVAAGGGSIAVRWGDNEVSLLDEALAFKLSEAPLQAKVAGGSIAFDGENFVLAALAVEGKVGSSDYPLAVTAQRLSPSGAWVDADKILGTEQQSGTFGTDVSIACKAVGDCAIAYSARLYGTGGETDQDIWLVSFKAGVLGAPVRITTANQDQLHPKLAWDGTNGNWVIAWVDLRFSSSASFGDVKGTQLYGARVTPAGALLDPIGVPLTTYLELRDDANGTFGTRVPTELALAANAGTLQLVWRGVGSFKLVGRRLDAELKAVDAAPVALASPGSSFVEQLSLLPRNGGFKLVAGKAGPGGFAVTNLVSVDLGLDGKAGGAPVDLGARFAYSAYATSLADGSLVLAKSTPGPKNDGLGKPHTDASVDKVDATGKELATAKLSRSLTVVDGRALAHAPGITAVVYADNRLGTNDAYSERKVYATVFGADGTPKPADGLVLPVAARDEVVAAAGKQRALVVWTEGPTENRDVKGRLLDDAGGVVKELSFGDKPYAESAPRVAFDGENFVVSWVDRGNGYDSGVLRRVSPDGAFVDPAFVLVAPGDTSNTSVQDLACSADGGCFVRAGQFYPVKAGVVGAASTKDYPFSFFDHPPVFGGATGFVFLALNDKTFADVSLFRVDAALDAIDQAPVDLFDANNNQQTEAKTRVVGWNGARWVAAWTSGKGIFLASLEPSATKASKPVPLLVPRSVPGPSASVGQDVKQDLLVGGSGDRTVVAYADFGRFWISGITAVEDDGQGQGGSGAGGDAGAGGSEAGTGGSGGTSGKGGAAGKGGTGGKGGAAGKGGSGGTGGKGGAAGKGGTGGKGGASGKGGTGGTSSGKGGTGGTTSGKGGSTGEDGGSGGKGGTSSGKGGSGTGQAGAASVNTSGGDAGDDGGCGCRVVGGETTDDRAELALGLCALGAVLLGRRRRKEKAG